MKVEIKCLHCENVFITQYKYRDKKFCNSDCYITYAKKNKIFGRQIFVGDKTFCAVFAFGDF